MVDKRTEVANISFAWVGAIYKPITQSHTQMITRNQSLSYLILLLLSVATLSADTIKLKDGSVLEGKVIKETQESIDFEYNITKSIKDIKTIKRSDIQVIDKEEADEVALEEIKLLLPTASLLNAEDYDKIIAGKPAAFMREFKDSKLKSSVQDVIDQLLAEKEKVEAQSVKINGKWITQEEAQKDPYNHNALILVTKMRASIENRQYLQALIQFEELEKNFEFSMAYSQSIKPVLGTLPKYGARLIQYKRNHPLRISQRTKDLKSMEASDRAQTEAAFQARQKRFEQLVTEAKELKKRWTPVSEWNLPSISENLEMVTKETERLEQIDLEKLSAVAKMIAGAFQDLAENKLTSAQAKLENAKSNGATGDIIVKISEQIDTGKKAARAAALENAETNEDTDTPDEDQDLETKDEKNTDTQNTKAKADERDSKASPNNQSSTSNETSEVESKGISFQLLISILAGVLLIVTLVAKFVIKSPEDDTE